MTLIAENPITFIILFLIVASLILGLLKLYLEKSVDILRELNISKHGWPDQQKKEEKNKDSC